MTPSEPSPLTAEEQALAERLARLGPRAEPSPALDARVLAAAHAAAQAPPAIRPALRRQRWPAIVGLAASLVLAVGLAWRLRPEPEPPPAPRSESAAAMRGAVPSAPTVPEPAAAAVPAKPAAPAESGNDAGIAPPTSMPEAKAPASAPPTPRAPDLQPPPAPEAQVVLDVPTPMAMTPPPPPPPAEPMRDVAPQARAAAAPAPAAVPAPTGQDSAFDAAANEAAQANASSDLRQGDEPSDEVPPATAESPAVRDAWLQRIQGLIDAGDIAGARASLREFERRYPDYSLPENLRALAR